MWEIRAPAFDRKYRAEYVGCPKKSVLLMQAPTVMRRIEDPGDSALMQAAWPSSSVSVPANLMQTIQLLNKVRPAPGNASESSGYDFGRVW